MFEYFYAKVKPSGYKKALRKTISPNQYYVPMVWTEHCVECSAPHCYYTCSRYQRRIDGACVRIKNGITPEIIDGMMGAKVEFRTWSKIEGKLLLQPIPGRKYLSLATKIIGGEYFLKNVADIRLIDAISDFITYGWYSFRQRYINWYVKPYPKNIALSLVGEVINNDTDMTLHVDIKNNAREVKYKDSIDVPVGRTTFIVNIPPYEDSDEKYYINLHPGNSEQHISLAFKQLELVPRDNTIGKKVKCVIWDLDNTLWDGVLIEDKKVKVRQDIVELIKRFDSCGIVNSIASKNNEEEVNAKLEELGIVDYFVFKKVNWDPKSVNVTKTIRQMNINPNTVVFVDDNPFERNEVLMVQPNITCIDPIEILDFAKCDRFNVVVTDDAKNRRNTYKMIESLKTEEEEWTGSIDEFLKSCNIKLVISNPNEDNILRCYELLQRTNQLNSSGRRLSLDEVKEIVKNPEYDAYVLQSSDKFGDYGIVGFLIVNKQCGLATITDFVISCRVANKKIEPSLINYLTNKYGGEICFNYKRTALNGPMLNVINDLKMSVVREDNGISIMLNKYIGNYPEIVKISDKTNS